MKIKYKFADGEQIEVEVSDEIGLQILDMERAAKNYERKMRYYHCISLEDLEVLGKEFATTETPETIFLSERKNQAIREALDELSESQKRRLLMLADGMSIQEIARQEGVRYYSVWKSIEAARKSLKKFFSLGD